MDIADSWESEFDREYRRGQRARAENNEGMARVCARRAAGVLVEAYFRRRGWPVPPGSVMNHLRMLRDAEDEVPAPVRELAGHFLLQITEEHILPGEVDLLEDVGKLRAALFPG